MTDLPCFPFPAGEGTQPPAEYARLLREHDLPRVRLPNGHAALLVTRHRDVRGVLADRRFSRSAFTAGTLFARTNESLALVTSDPPVHTRRRAAVAHEFTTRAVKRRRPLVEQLVARQVAVLASSGHPADLVDRFTLPLAVTVMCRILGLPEADLPLFKPWVDRMMSVSRFAAGEITEAHRQMHDYIAAAVETAAVEAAAAVPVTGAGRGPGPAPGGLIAGLLRPAGPDHRLSREEVVTLVGGLLMAGYETTSNVMAAGVYELLRRPALAARVRQGPAQAAAVVEELLRGICLIGSGGPPHVATADLTLPGGVPVAAGEVVVPVADAANRDPAVFAEPDALRVDRPHNPQLSFGHGPHYCLGAELARMELRLGIAALLAAFPGMRVAVADEQLRWRTDMAVRGLWELPVTW